MELKWEQRSEGPITLTVVFKGKEETLGWVLRRKVVHIDWYEVGIAGHVQADVMPCEDARYVTLRKAMRALKETVTVLLIGRGHGT